MNIPRSTSSVSRPSSEASTAPTPAVLPSTSGATSASYVPGIASRHAASGRGSEHPSGGGGGREDGQTHDVHAPGHALSARGSHSSPAPASTNPSPQADRRAVKAIFRGRGPRE